VRAWATTILCLFTALSAACDGGLLGTTNQPPRALAGDDVEVGEREVVSFDASASSDPDGRIVSYEWTFGDGTSSPDAVTTHAYENPGRYTVTLTVVDERGDDASDTRTVLVVHRNAAPVAEITAVNEALEDTAIEFSGAGSTDADSAIVSYAWNFGDSGTGSGASTTHTYTTPGTYTVTLTVTDDHGATGTAEAQVRIRLQPVTVPADSDWTWDLVNESDRPACGGFQAGPLNIRITGASVTITEDAGTTNVIYTGSYTAATRAFSATNNGSLGLVQSIHGAFDEQFQTFTGRYDVTAPFVCERSGAQGRPVEGTRL